MKKLKVIMFAAFALAIGSAFASNQNKASKGTLDYYRQDEKNPNDCREIQPCEGGPNICTKFIPALGTRVIYEEQTCNDFAFED